MRVGLNPPADITENIFALSCLLGRPLPLTSVKGLPVWVFSQDRLRAFVASFFFLLLKMPHNAAMALVRLHHGNLSGGTYADIYITLSSFAFHSRSLLPSLVSTR